MFKHVLVPTDLGEHSNRALEVGIELATSFGSALTLVHVHEIPVYGYPIGVGPIDLLTSIEEAARRELESTLATVRQKVPKATAILRSGVPWLEIISTIRDSKADLVVMGTHGRRGLTHALLGSVAEKIVRLSPVPVLTVRGSSASPEAPAR